MRQSPLAAGRRHSLARRGDGTVACAGNCTTSECATGNWREVVAVAAGNVHPARNTGRSHSLALTADGRVLATGWNDDGQCEVGEWRAVVDIAAGWRFSVVLLDDGTAVGAGRSREGQLELAGWRDLVAISCGDWHTVGLHTDGRVSATGNDQRGQCQVWDWRDIHAVSAGYLHTIGLTANGRVIGAGHRPSWAGSEDWREVVDVDAGSHHSLALTKRGRVLATGSDEGGQCQVQDWREVVTAPWPAPETAPHANAPPGTGARWWRSPPAPNTPWVFGPTAPCWPPAGGRSARWGPGTTSARPPSPTRLVFPSRTPGCQQHQPEVAALHRKTTVLGPAHTGADSGRSPHERRLHCPLARESHTTEGQSPHRTGPDQTETVVQT